MYAAEAGDAHLVGGGFGWVGSVMTAAAPPPAQPAVSSDDVAVGTALEAMGFDDPSEDHKITVKAFLNRLLGCPVALQETVFSRFSGNLSDVVAAAKESGQFDEGVSDLQGSAFALRSSETLFVDPVTGARTTLHDIVSDRGVSFSSALSMFREHRSRRERRPKAAPRAAPLAGAAAAVDAGPAPLPGSAVLKDADYNDDQGASDGGDDDDDDDDGLADSDSGGDDDGEVEEDKGGGSSARSSGRGGGGRDCAFFASRRSGFGRGTQYLLGRQKSRRLWVVTRPNSGTSAFEMEAADLEAKYRRLNIEDDLRHLDAAAASGAAADTASSAAASSACAAEAADGAGGGMWAPPAWSSCSRSFKSCSFSLTLPKPLGLTLVPVEAGNGGLGGGGRGCAVAGLIEGGNAEAMNSKAVAQEEVEEKAANAEGGGHHSQGDDKDYGGGGGGGDNDDGGHAKKKAKKAKSKKATMAAATMVWSVAVRPGDRVVAVNGLSTAALRFSDVVDLVVKAASPVTLRLARPPQPPPAPGALQVGAVGVDSVGAVGAGVDGTVGDGVDEASEEEEEVVASAEGSRGMVDDADMSPRSSPPPASSSLPPPPPAAAVAAAADGWAERDLGQLLEGWSRAFEASAEPDFPHGKRSACPGRTSKR